MVLHIINSIHLTAETLGLIIADLDHCTVIVYSIHFFTNNQNTNEEKDEKGTYGSKADVMCIGLLLLNRGVSSK
jgi:hypothetical protein